VKEKILSLPSPLGDPLELYKFSFAPARYDDTLSLVTGLHGDELNGIYLAGRLIQFLKTATAARSNSPYQLNQRVQIFPAVQLNALQAGTRIWPQDGLDMDLSFPGSDEGDLTEQLARAIYRHTFESTWGLILASAPEHFEDAPHAVCLNRGRNEKKLAAGLGLEIARVRETSPLRRVQLLHQWMEHEIPSLTLCAGRAGQLDQALCDSLFRGLLNLLLVTGILSHPEQKGKKGEVNFFNSRQEVPVKVQNGGLFLPAVTAGTRMKPGQKLGELRTIYEGDLVEVPEAPEEGILVSIRAAPVVYPSEPVAILLVEHKRRFWFF